MSWLGGIMPDTGNRTPPAPHIKYTKRGVAYVDTTHPEWKRRAKGALEAAIKFSEKLQQLPCTIIPAGYQKG